MAKLHGVKFILKNTYIQKSEVIWLENVGIGNCGNLKLRNTQKIKRLEVYYITHYRPYQIYVEILFFTIFKKFKTVKKKGEKWIFFK